MSHGHLHLNCFISNTMCVNMHFLILPVRNCNINTNKNNSKDMFKLLTSHVYMVDGRYWVIIWSLHHSPARSYGWVKHRQPPQDHHLITHAGTSVSCYLWLAVTAPRVATGTAVGRWGANAVPPADNLSKCKTKLRKKDRATLARTCCIWDLL